MADIRRRVEELLDTIEKDLGDLCHIDHVVDARERFYEKHRDPAGPGDILEIFGAEIPVGRRHPFEISVYYANGAAWRRESAEWRAQAEAWAKGRVDGIRAAVRLVVDPRGEELESAVHDLGSAVAALDVGVPNLVDEVVRTRLNDWQGEAKHSFDVFVGNVNLALGHQAWAVEALRVALMQAKTVIDMGQAGLVKALEQLSNGLITQLQKRVEEEQGTQELIAFFMFASAVTGILGSGALALPATTGALTALSAASPAFGLAKDLIPPEGDDYKKVPARRAGEYADQLDAAVHEVTTGTNAGWERAHELGAEAIRTQMSAWKKGVGEAAFEPPIPWMATRPLQPGEWHHPSFGR